MDFDYEIISTVILLLPLIQEGLLSVTLVAVKFILFHRFIHSVIPSFLVGGGASVFYENRTILEFFKEKSTCNLYPFYTEYNSIGDS